MRTLTAAGHRLEYDWQGPGPGEAPTLVLLHEGLGSAGLWRDFPARLAAATGWGALSYSRRGYGGSEGRAPPWPLEYMREEAALLPAVLAAAGVGRHALVGHSDGGSIALAYAGSQPGPGLLGLVLLAPHVFVEELSVRSIAAAREAYQRGGLRERLARWHGANVDDAFWGWNRAWLDPGFRAWSLAPELARVEVPALVIQGAEDEYGTLAQVEAIEAGSRGRVERRVLAGCGHSPQRDRPEETLAAAARFVGGLVEQ